MSSEVQAVLEQVKRFLIREMPRNYKCRKWGEVHGPPTGKHCRAQAEQEDEEAEPAPQVLNLLLEIRGRMDNFDQRLQRVEEKGSETSSIAQEEPPMDRAEMEETPNVDTRREEDTTPQSLMKDITLMAEAASRIAQLQMNEYNEVQEGTGITVRKAHAKKSGSVMMASDIVQQTIDWPHLHVRRMEAGRAKGLLT